MQNLFVLSSSIFFIVLLKVSLLSNLSILFSISADLFHFCFWTFLFFVNIQIIPISLWRIIFAIFSVTFITVMWNFYPHVYLCQFLSHSLDLYSICVYHYSDILRRFIIFYVLFLTSTHHSFPRTLSLFLNPCFENPKENFIKAVFKKSNLSCKISVLLCVYTYMLSIITQISMPVQLFPEIILHSTVSIGSLNLPLSICFLIKQCDFFLANSRCFYFFSSLLSIFYFFCLSLSLYFVIFSNLPSCKHLLLVEKLRKKFILSDFILNLLVF
jgi:hypothetical protein